MNLLNINPVLFARWVEGDQIAFKIGSLEVAWYGIFMMIGFLLAIVAASLKLRFWYKVSYDPFLYFCLIGIPVSILGSRTWSFIIGDSEIETNFFVDFWKFKQGGLAIQGGVVATVIAACIYFPLVLKKPTYHVKTMNSNGQYYVRQVSMWVYADAIIPCILIGQIVGRWGNFFNQEVYGGVIENPEVTMAWLKTLMPGVYDWMFIDGTFHHPLFLYESFFNFWIFVILYVGCEFIKFRKAGDLGILYFVFYGILRLCMEPFRDTQFKYTTSIVTSVLYIAFGIVFLILNHFVISKNREKKILYSIFVYTRYYLFMLNPKLLHDKSWRERLGCKVKPNLIRKEEEMLYYNGY